MIARVEKRALPPLPDIVLNVEMSKAEAKLLRTLAYLGDQTRGEYDIRRALPHCDFAITRPRDEFLRPLNRIVV